MQQKARRAGRMERLEAALDEQSKACVRLGGANASGWFWAAKGQQLEVEWSCQCSSEKRGIEVATGAVGKVTGPVWDRAGGHWAGAPGQQRSGRTAWHEWLSASTLTLYVLVH